MANGRDLAPISERGQAALESRQAAEAAGFNFGGEQPWFAYGTELIDVGKKSWQESRRLMSELPLASDMTTAIQAKIAAEERKDFALPVNALTMTSAGRIANGYPELQNLSIDENAFRQLVCGRAGAPSAAASYVPSLPLPIVVATTNHHLAHPKLDGEGNVPRVMLRTRAGVEGAGRSIYAAVSPGYQRHDVDQVAAALAANVHQTARGKCMLGAEQWMLQAQFGSPIEPVVGDVFTSTISLRGADNGTRGIKVQVAMEQARCVNLTRINVSQDIGGVIAHRGKNLGERIAESIQLAYAKVSTFVERWAEASESQIVYGMDLGVEQVFATLLANGNVNRPVGMTSEEFVDACVRAYWTAPEYGLTQRGVSYALTKAAQQLSPWACAGVEEEAGELLYNFVTINESSYQRAAESSADTSMGRFFEID